MAGAIVVTIAVERYHCTSETVVVLADSLLKLLWVYLRVLCFAQGELG